MQLYNDYNTYLKTKYGCKVYKIGLDAGFSCPNRDGTKGYEGCIYCNEDGSRASYTASNESIAQQLKSRIKFLAEKKGAKKFIGYFQAFTNTYAPVDKLKKLYDEVLPFKEVVGISIGTRPDVIDRDKLKLISSYKNRYEVWLEYGLQSINDCILKYLNRGHNVKDFLNAVSLTKEFKISVCAHIILGLPGETKSDMIQTAKKLSELNIDGVKIHLLHILKGSHLTQLYKDGKIKLLEQNEYVDIVCDFLEYLAPNIIIQRLTGEGTRQNHIAPLWAFDKIGTINKIKERLQERGSCQGIKSYCRSLSQRSLVL